MTGPNSDTLLGTCQYAARHSTLTQVPAKPALCGAARVLLGGVLLRVQVFWWFN